MLEPEPDCERFRAIASLQLDAELTRLERALHRAHAAACDDCREYAAEVAGITACIRATPPQGLQRGVVVRSRSLRKRSASAVAALAIGLVIAAGLRESQQPGAAATPEPAVGGTAGALKAI